MANIRANPRNPRRLGLDTSSIAEMVRSIQAEGLLEPVLVRELERTPIAGAFYELIAGERRWRAFQMMGAAVVPARVLEADEAGAAAKCLVGFLQSKSATPMEEAIGYRDAMELADRAGVKVFSVAELSRRTGRPEAVIRERLLLCELPKAGQKALLGGRLPVGHAVLVARLPEAEAREALLKRVLQGNDVGQPYTEEGLQSLLRAEFMRDLRVAPFRREDAGLVAAVGACSTCVHRTGANPGRFGECKRGAAQVCTRPACYRAKVEASRLATKADLEAEGVRVLGHDECEAEFPAGHKGLRYDSAYCELTRPVPAELLKSEVAEHGAVTWEELLENFGTVAVAGETVERPEVPMLAGFDQDGRVVRLVERKLAIAAVDAGDKHIFKESDRRAVRITAEAVMPRAKGQGVSDKNGAGGKAVAAPVRVSLNYAEAQVLLEEIDDYLTRRGHRLTVEAKAHPERFIEPMAVEEAAKSAKGRKVA